MTEITLILFLIAHVLGDFYLQSKAIAKGKQTSFKNLVIHGIVYLLAMAMVILPLLGLTFLKWVLLAASLHFLVDWFKILFTRKRSLTDKNKTRLYLMDQLLHVILLAGTVFLAAQVETIQWTNLMSLLIEYFNLEIGLFLKWMLALLIVIKPVSITIGIVLWQYQPITVDKEEVGHPGVGALIGILERLIILVMLSQSQYAAIGFVLTAKSIARYNKLIENPQFSEYYLLGTLLSMLLVIVTHTVIVL
ncbi:MAG: DUF3307 domain-containing protein [Clostridium sp.]|nr:DUF3307 domain-containing protein [Clostridium sp.]